MTSIGELSVELGLDTSLLDKQIAQLGSQYKDFKFSASFDGKGLEAEFKRCKDKFSRATVSIGLSFDGAGLEAEFRKYRDRFSNQFVKLNLQLDSRGLDDDFRRYQSKFSNQSLTLGVRVDSVQVAEVRSQLERQLSGINVTVRAASQVQSLPVQGIPLTNSFFKEFEKEITDSIGKGFKQTSSGNIFGGLGSIIMAPLRGAMQGFFLGIGDPLGRQVGTGLTKGLQSTLGESIGSFEFLGQKFAEGIVKNRGQISNSLKTVVESIPFGEVLIKQAESANRVIQRKLNTLKINPFNPESVISLIASPKEIQTEFSARRYETTQAQLKTKQQSQIGLGRDIVLIPEFVAAITASDKTIKETLPRLSDNTQSIKRLTPKIARLQRRIQVKNLKELTDEGKKQLQQDREQLLEYLQERDRLEVLFEQDSNALALLKLNRSSNIAALQKVTERVGIVGQDTSQLDQLLELNRQGDKISQEIVSKQQRLNAATSRDTRFDTPESIKQAKESQLSKNVAVAEKAYKEEFNKPKANVKTVQALERQYSKTKKALDLFQLELIDPKALQLEIDALTKQSRVIADESTKLAKELQTATEPKLKAISRNLSDKVITTAKGGTALDTSGRRAKAQEALAKNSLTPLIGTLVQEIAQAEGFKIPSFEQLPRVVIKDKIDDKGSTGSYLPSTNTIAITEAAAEQLQKGVFELKNVITLTHELIHGFQFEFGEISEGEILATGKAGIPAYQATAKELQQIYPISGKSIATGVESSVKGLKESMEAAGVAPSPERLNLARQLEEQAYTRGLALGPRMQELLSAKQTRSQYASLIGTGGKAAELTLSKSLIQQGHKLAELRERLTLLKNNDLNKIYNEINSSATSLEKQLAVSLEAFKDQSPNELSINKLKSLVDIYVNLKEKINNLIAVPLQELEASLNEITGKPVKKIEVKLSETPKQQLTTAKLLAQEEWKEQEKARLAAEQEAEQEYKASIVKSPTAIAIRQMVASISGVPLGTKATPDLVEAKDWRLGQLDLAGASAAYEANFGEVWLRSETAKQLRQPLKKGLQIDDFALRKTIHEIRHAAQTQFGAISDEQLAKGNFGVKMLKATPEELKAVGGISDGKAYTIEEGIEHSTKYSGLTLPPDIIKQIEEDAYVFEHRVYQHIQEALHQGLSEVNLDEVLKQVYSVPREEFEKLTEITANTPQKRQLLNSQTLRLGKNDIYQDLFKYLSIVNKTDADFGKLPSVVTPKELPSHMRSQFRDIELGTGTRVAAYMASGNRIIVSEYQKAAIDAGRISKDFFGVILHELQHAFQHDFGRRNVYINNQAAVELSKGTPEQREQLKQRIEASVSGVELEKQDLSRQIETDAYVKEVEHTTRAFEQITHPINQAIDAVETTLTLYANLQTVAGRAGVEVPQNINHIADAIAAISQSIQEAEKNGQASEESAQVFLEQAKFLTSQYNEARADFVKQFEGTNFVDREYSAATIEHTPNEKLPETYKAIAQAVASYSNLAEFQIPELAIPDKGLQATFDKTGTVAAFLSGLNKVALKPELLKHMQSGQKLDYQAVGLSVHELRHAAQLGFGKLSQSDLSKGKFAVDLLVPTPEELAVFGQELEQSIAAAKIAMPDVPEDIIRAIEQDAYTFELRYGQKIYEAIQDTGKVIEQKIDSIDIDSIDISGLSDEQFDYAQYMDDAQEAVEDVYGEFDAKVAALRETVQNTSVGLTNQLDSLAAEVEATTAQVSQSTETAIASEEQKLEAGIAEAAQAYQELIDKLADPGLTGEDIKEIAKLAEIPGRGAKGLKRKDREKLVAESVIKGETSPEALAQIVRAVETKRAKERIYKDTGIPKSETDWAKKTAGDLAQSSVEKIQDFGKRSQSVLQKAIVQAKAISDPTARLEELDRIRASIIEHQSAILEASGTHTDAAAKKHLEMLRVRLQSDRKSLGLAMTAAQSEVTKSIAQAARAKPPTLSGGGMEQAVRQNPGALFAAGAFGGRQNPELEQATSSTQKGFFQGAEFFEQMKAQFGDVNFFEELKDRFLGNSAPKLKERPRQSKLSFFNGLNIGGVTKQAGLLATEAQTLLGDIEVQLALAEAAERETKIIERQIKADEKRIQKIVRRQSIEQGRRALGQGRLSEKQHTALETERFRLEQGITEKRAEVQAKQKPRAQRKELTELTKSTRNAIAETSTILGKESLTDKDVKRLGELRTQLALTFDRMQQPIPGNNFLAQFGLTIPNVLEKLGGLIKGFLAFQGVMFVQNQLRSFSTEAFQAAIAVSNLKTSLNFSEGGMAQGTQALTFVRQKVEDLRIPLQSSIEGYAKLSASTRNTPIQGKSTRELFTGVSEAATVQGLTPDRVNNVYIALSQIAAKGTVSLEELRGQLAENLPGALTIAAQAMGMTQEQLMKLIESGQLASQDFLPRFAAALHANFGDAAKEASGNAQSALYNFQNSLQTLKESFGEAISPSAAAGLNALSGAFGFLAKHGGELAAAITALSVALAVQLGTAIASTLGTGSALDLFFLGIRKAVAGTWAAIAPMMGQMLLTMGAVFVAIEGFKIASHYINGGELAQQFKQMEDAAARAAKGIQGVKQASFDLKEEINTPPPNNWWDSAVLGARNQHRNKDKAAGWRITQPFTELTNWAMGGIKTTAESDRDKAVASIVEAGKDIEKAQKDLQERLTNPNYNRGEAGTSLFNSAERMMGREPRTEVEVLKDDLKSVDDQLQRVSQQRKTLQAEIARNYTNLGKAVPPELKEQLLDLSQQFQFLSTQRVDLAKPYQEQLQNVTKFVEQNKTLLDVLNTPEGEKAFSGITRYQGKNYQLPELKKQVEKNLAVAKESKNTLETLIQSTNADPVLTLAQAFRELNAELARNVELAAMKSTESQQRTATQQLEDWGKDASAAQKAALRNAKDERDRIQREIRDLEESVAKRSSQLSSGSSQALMKQLGVDENSTAADIQKRLDAPDAAYLTEGEKGILEDLKRIQEDKLKLSQAGLQATKNEMEVRQQMEAKATDEINRRVQEREAILKREQNAAGENIKREVLAGKASIEQAIEQTANLPVEYAEKSIESANQQLSELEAAYKRGEISYRTYEERKRDILNQLSDLRKQKTEAVEQAITKLIGWHAAKRESLLKRQQNEAPELIKQRVISGGVSLDKGVEQTIKLPSQFTDKQIDDTKAQLKEIEEAWKKGQLSVETYDAKRRELTDRLSDLRKQKIEQIEQAITEVIALHAAKREAILRREQNAAPETIKWQAISGKINLRQASERLDRMPATFTGKQIENTLAQLKEVEAAFRRGEMNVKAYEEKRRELTTALSDQRRQQIEQIEQATTNILVSHVADREALIKREEFAAIASVRRRYLARTTTEKQAAEDIARINLNSTNKQVAAMEAQLKEYQNAFARGQLNPKAYMEKERELVTSLHDLKKQQIEQEIALRDAGNAKILEGIELANRLAEAQIQKFSDSQTQLIKRSQLEDRPEYVASRQLEQLQGETLNKQIEDTKRRMSETDNLYRKGVITDPKQYTEQRLQLEQQLAQQQIQLLDNQIAQQKRLREEQTKAIDDRIRGQERSQELANAQLDLQAKGIELQVKEVELIQKADDLSKQLLESRHNLAKALSDAELGQTQIRLDAMSRGKDLMSKVLTDDRFSLNTSDVDIANLKAVLGSQLGELGIGVDFDNIRQLKRSADMGSVAAQRQLNQYEIAVLDARSRLEDELAAKKLNALGLEQQFQRENLDLELRRGELQARSALFAAKQAEFQVQQSKLQLETQAKLAKLEEEKAKLIEDPRDRVRAIADARAKLELATGQLDLVPDQLLNAQGLSAIAAENVSAQEELALNAKRAMDATQVNERSQFVAAQNARKQAEQLERAEAAAKRTAAANAAGSGGLSFANLSYEQKQQLDVAMQTLDSYSGPMDEGQRRSGLVSAAMSGNPFLNLLLRQQGDKDIVDIAEKMKANSNPFDLSASQARMSAQLNNRDVVSELQRLNENVSRLASEPRSISVSTATPMEDTLRIMSNVNRP